jgi:hypothetical protein
MWIIIIFQTFIFNSAIKIYNLWGCGRNKMGAGICQCLEWVKWYLRHCGGEFAILRLENNNMKLHGNGKHAFTDI